MKRFWDKVEKTDTCWNWKACTTEFGYGLVRINKVNVRAHRYSWECVNGPVPKGLCVLHHCDNPKCVNPEHLFLGTKKDNAADRMMKGRPGSPGPIKPFLGEKHQNSRLTDRAVYEIRDLAKSSSQRSIAKLYGVTFQTIHQVVRNKTWTHLLPDGMPVVPKWNN